MFNIAIITDPIECLYKETDTTLGIINILQKNNKIFYIDTATIQINNHNVFANVQELTLNLHNNKYFHLKNKKKIKIFWSNERSKWKISKIRKLFKKKNVYYRPWGRYVNLFEGKNFLVKELTVNSKSSISLQKHHHRSEHWMITHGKPKITINKKKFFKKPEESVFIPTGAVHRIENYFKKPVKIIEVQTGPILKETDIVRFQDIYGRIK